MCNAPNAIILYHYHIDLVLLIFRVSKFVFYRLWTNFGTQSGKQKALKQHGFVIIAVKVVPNYRGVVVVFVVLNEFS